MYPRPQRIWVAGLVCQSAPALASLDPGSACGMPYAPDVGLVAEGFQPLSRFQRLCKHPNWLDDQPNELSIAIAICWGDPEGVAELGAGAAGGWAALWAACWAASAAARRAAAWRFAASRAASRRCSRASSVCGSAVARRARTAASWLETVAGATPDRSPVWAGRAGVAGWAWPSGAAEATPEATATVATAVTPTTIRARLGGLRCLAGFRCLPGWRCTVCGADNEGAFVRALRYALG